MYYIKTIEDKMRLPPDMFGSKPEDALLKLVRERFERRLFRDAGIILSVNNVDVLSKGIVIPGDSGAYYKIKFDALTFLPYINEVFNGEIKEIVEFGAFTSVGPLQGLLHVSQIGREKFYYDKKGKGLTSRAAKKAVKKNDDVVVKVSTVSMKTNMSDTKIGLTMRPDGLGKIQWLEEKEKPKSKPVKKKGGKK